MATPNRSGSAAPAPRPVEGHTSAPGVLDLVLFEHQDGRYAAALPGADFLAGDPKWHRAGPVAVYVPAAAGSAPAPEKAVQSALDALEEQGNRLYDVAVFCAAIDAMAWTQDNCAVVSPDFHHNVMHLASAAEKLARDVASRIDQLVGEARHG